ncbi:Listeria/Bacterioides repeat-containing protein [Pseudobutyrivibrio sp. OR37]|uniref:InlB B-repeat-containing protein n=1 Tax=Pseudobutyrivibrio sp. OR37 TaxID=1798186 RepID=UPI0008F3F4E1|nr:InlB B-repeat-containing protein [Pseudobutyrivibrio sp. OR37]SFI26372.1 Listeria/Bacterioides repeat-containing protein [Pseudobutyrivibrio sp. OR37]
MHIKRLLSGSLAALMVASSFNVPVVNAAAIDEPTEVVEETADDNSGAGDDGAGKQEEAGTTTFTFDDDLNGDEGETDIVPEETTPDEGQEGDEDSVNLDNLLRANLLGNSVPTMLGATSISGATVTLSANSAAYTGSDVKPTVTKVEVGETPDVVPGSKYDVEYWTTDSTPVKIDEIKDVGTYTVKVKAAEGQTDFEGEATASFEVTGFAVTFAAGNGGTGSISPVANAGKYILPDSTGLTPNAGFTFAGWSVEIGESTPVTKAVGEEIHVTAATTVTALWTDNRTDVATMTFVFSKPGSTERIKDASVVYGTTDLQIAKAQLADGTVVENPNSLFDIKYKASGSSDAPVALTDETSPFASANAGNYTIVITPKSTATAYKADSKKEIAFKITPKEITAAEVVLKTEASDLLGANYGYDSTKKAYTLKYNPNDPNDDNIDERGTVAYAVEPLKNVGSLAEANYTVAYKNNDKVGTATVTITLKDTTTAKNYAFANGSKTIEKTFEIIDADETFADVDITKAKVSNKTQTDGSIKYKDSATNKVTTKVVPKMDPSKTTIGNTVDLTESNVGTATIDGLFDANGKKLQKLNTSTNKLVDLAASDYVVSAVANGSEGIVTVTFKSTEPENTKYLYEGSYDFKYTFVADCTEHSWHKVITKVPGIDGTTAGAYEYRCDKCKKVASTNDRIKVDGKYVTVPASCTIPALTLETLKVTNRAEGDAAVDVKTVSPTITFKGSDIVAVTDSSTETDNACVTYVDGSNTVYVYKNKVIVKKTSDSTVVSTTEYKDDIFTFKYENNKAVAQTAKVTLTFTGVLEDFKGATVTKAFEITKATENLQAPIATVDKLAESSSYHYGTKVTLASPTKNAKIYYSVSRGATAAKTIAVTGTPATDLITLENAIDDKDLVEYTGPIELVDTMTTDIANSITLFVVATDGKSVVKAATSVVYAYEVAADSDGKYTFTMIPAATDYQGDVENDDLPAGKTAKDVPEGFWISELTKAQFNSATYDGKAHVFDDGLTTSTYTDDIRVFYGNKLLTLDKDFTLKYTNNVNAWVAGNAASKQPTVTVTGKGEYTGAYTYKFEIAPLAIADATNAPITGLYVDPSTTVTIPETNAIQKPSFKLYTWLTAAANAKTYVTLVANKDYTVDYSNMGKEPGAYPVTINGMGNYTGSIAATVNVVDAGIALSKATVSFDTKNVVFDGTNQDVNVVPTVKIGDKILERGTDYDVVFVHTLNPYSSLGATSRTAYYSDKENHVYQAGKYTVTIVPGTNGKYAGSITKTLSITNKGDVAITKATIEGIANNEKFDYRKNPLTDSNIKLSYNGKTLTEGVDYLLGINDPKTGIGNGKLVIYGIGKFSGNKQFTYNVLTAGKLTKNDVEITDVTYDGTAQAPDIKVKFSGDADVEPQQLIKYDPIAAPNGAYEVKYVTKDLVNAGTKTIKITGKNGYTGSFNVTYKVNPFDFDADQAKYDAKHDRTENNNVIQFEYLPDARTSGTAEPIATVPFTGKGVAPVISFRNTDLNWPEGMTYSTWVSQNFSFKYSSNANKVGATVTVTATPKKNIKGSAVTMQYEVEKASLKAATITIKDKAADKTWANPAPVVKWGTKTLTNKKDYTVKYMYLNATTVTNKKAKVNRAAYAEVVAGDVIPANTVILARFEGTGNYTDSQDVQFRYLAKNYDISKATVKVYGSYFYDSKTGELPKLDVNDITVIIDGIVVDPKNYSIVDYAYPKNIIGTAKATLRGNEAYNYGGEKVVSFKIEKPQAKYMLQFMADSKAFDGSTLTITGQTARMTNAKSNTFTLPNSGFTAKKVTRQADGKKVSEKYVLRGWRAEDGTLHGVGELYTVKDDTGRVETLTAVFEKPRTGTYTVKFSKGTDAKITGDLPKDITANYGKVYQLPNAPKLKKVGYKFIGWKNTGDNITYKAGTKIYNLPDVTGKSLTYEAQFVATPYKVTFNMQGGVAVKAIAYENDAAGYASAVAQINAVGAAAIRDGYTFNGWKESPKGAVLKEIKITEGKNFTLYADWKPNKFKVTYYANGVSATVPTDSTEYSVGEKVTLKAMTATDATFLGWAKNQYAAKPDYKGGQVVSNFTPSGNTIDLYAIWATEAYTITYDMNGGTYKGTAQLPSTFTATNKPALAAAGSTDFVRAGMKFDGWAEGTSSKIGSKVTTLENRDYKLVATWVADTTTHKISFVTNGSTSMTDQTNITNGSTVSIKPLNRTEVTKENYVFSGWDTNSAATTVVYGDGANITVSGSDITLYGVWSTESYPITYNLAGGKFTSAPTKQNTFTVANLTVGLPNVEPVKNGYTFAGYKFKDDVAATSVGAATVTFDKAEAKILTAQWTGQTRTINYAWAGGTVKEGKTPKTSDTYTVGADNNPTALPNGTDYEKAGYTFAGWTLGGEDVTFAGLKLNDTDTPATLNLVAKWNPVTYTVSYKNTNGAKFKKNADGKEFVAPTSYKQTDGTDGTVAINDLEDTATQTFAGWTVKVGSAEPTVAKKGVSLTATIAGNVELTATWTNKAKTTVKFDANEGTGSMADQVVYAGDQNVTLKPVAFTRTGYSFDGWATTKTGSVEYDDEDALTPASSDSTITLYAKWTPWTRQVTLKSTVGSVSSISPISYTDAESARIRTIPEPTGAAAVYTFKGWALKSNGGVTYAPTQAVDLTPQYANQKTILYAVWEEAKHATVVVDLDGGTAGSTAVLDKSGAVYVTDLTDNKLEVTVSSAETAKPTKAGYTFSKWEVSGATLAEGKFAVTAANVTNGATITVKAKYTVNTYNITYDDGIAGTTEAADNWKGTSFETSNPNPTNWKVTDGVRTLTNPTRTGYSFKGWRVSGAEDETATKYFKLDTATVRGNLTLVAVWTPISYKITYNLNEGTNDSGNPANYTIESSAIILKNPTKANNDFGGWYTNAEFTGNPVTSIPAGSTGNVTLYAKWTPTT